MFTTVRVSKFLNGTKRDKNGKSAVFLNYISGERLPNSTRVLSGTIADSNGLEEGKTYLIKAEKTSIDETYGDQYTVTKVSELTGDNLLSLFADQVRSVQAPEVKLIKKAVVDTPAAVVTTVEEVTPVTAAAEVEE